MVLDFESIIADPATAYAGGEIGANAAMLLLEVDHPDELARILEEAGLTAPEAEEEAVASFLRL
jgi:hypothetical protein